jgi:hypothetical protein
MTLTLCTMVRDAASRGTLARFHRQVGTLERRLHAPLTVVLAEGDSKDHTRLAIVQEAERAKAWHRRTVVLDVSHGGPFWGSTEEPARLAGLSRIFNRVLDAAAAQPYPSDVVVWVESDLHWTAATILRLASHVDHKLAAIVAPMTHAGVAYYDTWGCRLLDGRRIDSVPPHLPPAYVTAHAVGALVEMSSVGSVVAMSRPVARDVRISGGGAIVEWCAVARGMGHRVWLDTGARVEHPHQGFAGLEGEADYA